MGGDPLAPVLSLAAAGLPAFQWREKDLSPLSSHRFLERLLEGLKGAGAPTQLYMNDRVDVAAALHIGVHLPEEGLPTRAAREILGPAAAIGRSTHSVDAARRARDEGASFVTFGPVFDTPSKRAFGTPKGIAALEAVARAVPDLPILALGGITPERVAACLEAGAYGVAVIGAVWDAADPVAAFRCFAGDLNISSL